MNAEVTMDLSCSNANGQIQTSIIPGTIILYRKSGMENEGKSWNAVDNIRWIPGENTKSPKNAVFDVVAEDGVDYDFYINLNNKVRTRTETITGDSTTTFQEDVSELCK